MIISVTKTDIKLAKRNCPDRCPIARSIRRKLKLKLEDVFVWPMQREIFILDNSYILSEDAAERARHYDRGGMMEPFKFSIYS